MIRSKRKLRWIFYMNISLFHSGLCQWIQSLYMWRKINKKEEVFLLWEWYQNERTLSKKYNPYDWEPCKLLPRLKFIYKNLR